MLEASILASRARRLPAAEIRAELARLAVVVDKTAGPRERAAMDLVLAPRARRARRRMTTVRVEAAARLHMGMLDASGDGERRFGGLGVAVRRPAAVVEATQSDDVTAEGPDAERALAVARARCVRRSAPMFPAPGSAWSRRSRRTSASARARSSRSP